MQVQVSVIHIRCSHLTLRGDTTQGLITRAIYVHVCARQQFRHIAFFLQRLPSKDGPEAAVRRRVETFSGHIEGVEFGRIGTEIRITPSGEIPISRVRYLRQNNASTSLRFN